MNKLIEGVELYHYSLPLVKPLRLSAAVLTQRDVLLLKWRFQGRDYWTEVAPLPGYSSETLEQAQAQLSGFFKLESQWSPDTLADNLVEEKDSLYPSVDMGLAAFLLELEPTYFGVPRVCPLLTERELSAGNEFEFDPHTSVAKIKVGLKALDEDVERIRRICSINDFKGKLRLDANQQWTPELVQSLCEKIDLSRIEWVEDPLPDPQQYTFWQEFSRIPFAYDETLYKSRAIPENSEGLKAVILKPMLLGMSFLVDLVDWAQENQKEIIVSSGFETPVGLRSLYGLANKHARKNAHGLDTLKYYHEPAHNGLVAENLQLEHVLL